MFRAYDVMKIEIFFEHFSSINAKKKKKKESRHTKNLVSTYQCRVDKGENDQIRKENE